MHQTAQATILYERSARVGTTSSVSAVLRTIAEDIVLSQVIDMPIAALVGAVFHASGKTFR